MNKPYNLLDNFQDIKEIHKIIIFQTGDKVEKIAKRVEYSREHLTGLLKGRGPEKVIRDLRDKLVASYEKDILRFVSKYGKINSSGRDTELKVLIEFQVALTKIVLTMASENKSVYNKSVAILKTHNLEGMFL